MQERRLNYSAGMKVSRSPMMQLIVVCSLLLVGGVGGKDFGFQYDHKDAVQQLLGKLMN